MRRSKPKPMIHQRRDETDAYLSATEQQRPCCYFFHTEEPVHFPFQLPLSAECDLRITHRVIEEQGHLVLIVVDSMCIRYILRSLMKGEDSYCGGTGYGPNMYTYILAPVVCPLPLKVSRSLYPLSLSLPQFLPSPLSR